MSAERSDVKEGGLQATACRATQTSIMKLGEGNGKKTAWLVKIKGQSKENARRKTQKA
jgi:hypothetical protein